MTREKLLELINEKVQNDLNTDSTNDGKPFIPTKVSIAVWCYNLGLSHAKDLFEEWSEEPNPVDNKPDFHSLFIKELKHKSGNG